MCLAVFAACSSASTDADKTPSDGGGPDGGDPGIDGGPNPDDGGDPVPDGGTGKPITSCTVATLWAGNPTYDAPDPSTRPADGTGILEDPPFQWGNLTFVGDMLYTRDTGEIWSVDTSVASPVERRLIGMNGGNEVTIKFGKCSEARLGAIQGIADLPDGSLVAADAFANSIVHIANPTDAATCTVESWAGTNADTTFSGTSYPNLGDVDGPIGTSRIGYPTAITTDGAGIVFFYDGQARKFKKIANDANHTVSTIGAMPDGLDISYGMVHIGSTVYALGYGGSTTNIYKIEGTAITKVAGGDPSAWEGLETTPQLGGIATDGTNLIVAGQGFVWLVSTTGTIKHIAGSGERIDVVKPGYDPKAPHPALEVTLKPRAGASSAAVGSPDYLGFKDGAIYYRGHGVSTASYVEKISCN
ncbi:MAG: hypothetical protein KIS78_09265 [Labilithrix sp.]|nr:hypothetical protein [Labilithrix sp.]MCW5832585.1 hypothetical protein [Labilithrix sp.]